MSAPSSLHTEPATFLSMDCSAVAFARMEQVRLRARDAVQKAIKTRKIVRPDACEQCGATGKLESHHHDYYDVLNVRWLCIPCHKEISRRITEDARESIERMKGVPLWLHYAKTRTLTGTTAVTTFPDYQLVYGRED